MNRRGFAVSGIIYTVLIIFIILLISILSLLNSRKNVLDTLKNKVLGEVNDTSSIVYDPFIETGKILEFSARARGYYSFEVISPKITNNGSKVTTEIFLEKGESLYILIGASNYNGGKTEIRTIKNDSNSTIIKASATSYVADSYQDRKFMNTSISNNSVTATTGKVVVKYLNKERKNSDLNKVKYIKDCINGNSLNNENNWSEIQAIVAGNNKAVGKKVTASSDIQNPTYITDNSLKTIATSVNTGEQCVIVDLERTYNLDSIIISHKPGATYHGNKTYVSTDGVNYIPVNVLEKNENNQGIVISAYETKTVEKVEDVYVPVKEFDNALWLRVFHHNNLNGTLLWDSISQPLTIGGYDKLHKQSILYNLDSYKNKSGQLEFLLEYSDISGYNRWIQTSNPATTSESVTGYKAVKLSWNGNYWQGLAKSNSGAALIDGSVNHNNWYYAIGVTRVWNGGIPGPDNNSIKGSTDLWVRIDNIR